MVIISNGFNKFHLAVAAAEMEKKGLLSLLISGAYPTNFIDYIKVLPFLKKNARFNRLLARGEEISERRVKALWFSELIHVMRLIPEHLGCIGISDCLDAFSFRLYGYFAAKALFKAPANARIYHYRSGFGGKSVNAAKRLGMITICDHSIVHPAVFSYLVNNGGKMPVAGQMGQMNRLWMQILLDIEQADVVLVNSEFVKNTFVHMGWDPAKIYVIYLGVDEQFLRNLPLINFQHEIKSRPLRLIFAGSFETRKGAEVLIAALKLIRGHSWQLEIAGGINKVIKRKNASFFKDPRVKYLGRLTRSELAQRICTSDVFVFPSLAEGSARVIFEALAAGCYIITTPNSGSIVKDGVNGTLVFPNDADCLAEAIQRAILQPKKVKEVGLYNAKIVRMLYKQEHYGNELYKLYCSFI